MKLIKYSKSTNSNEASNNGGNGSTSTTTISRAESGDREIWGQYDNGEDDIDGSMVVNGNVTIKAIIPPTFEDDDEDDDGEDEEYEEGGGNLEVEGNLTAGEAEIENNLTIGKHLFVNLTHSNNHTGEKKCLIDVTDNNTTEITNLKTRVSTAETNINTNTTNITTNTNNISSLDTRVTKLENKRNIGYYWSAIAQVNSSNQPTKPVEPLSYIGTDIGTFEVTESKPYLWRTIDGENFTIVSYWVPAEAEKYYIASTFLCGHYDLNNKVKTYPAGLLCFYAPNLTTPMGKSAWTSTTYTFELQGGAEPNLNYPSAIFSTISGKIPRVEGYPYIWEIKDIADANDYTKWTLLQSGTSGGSASIIHSISYADWGNRSVAPGYAVFPFDTETKLVGDEFFGQHSNKTYPYITGEGTADHWNNPIWRKSFLMHALSEFLWQNRTFYNDKIGWSFNWGGACNSTGYGGQWTCRLGGIEPPSSDNPNDIDYYPNSTIGYLFGYVYSETGGTPMRIDFAFHNIRLGKKLPYSMESFSAAGTVSNTGRQWYWDVEYGRVYYKFTDSGATSTE